jgi:hypothetical protein
MHIIAPAVGIRSEFFVATKVFTKAMDHQQRAMRALRWIALAE